MIFRTAAHEKISNPKILTCQPVSLAARLSPYYIHQIYSLGGKCMNTRLLACPKIDLYLSHISQKVSGAALIPRMEGCQLIAETFLSSSREREERLKLANKRGFSLNHTGPVKTCAEFCIEGVYWLHSDPHKVDWCDIWHTGHPLQQIGRATKFHAAHVCVIQTQPAQQQFLFTCFKYTQTRVSSFSRSLLTIAGLILGFSFYQQVKNRDPEPARTIHLKAKKKIDNKEVGLYLHQNN